MHKHGAEFGPIPSFREQRQLREKLELRYDFDTDNPLYRDPLVDPRSDEYGLFDSSSYYSKPNEITGDILPGIPNAPLVRRDIARRLKIADEFLRTNQDVKTILGSNARIRIDDALRPYVVQKFAYEIAWPKIIRMQNPHITEQELRKIRDLYVAKPSGIATPSPHATGGAVDVILINCDTNMPFDRGHSPGGVAGSAFPDYYENDHIWVSEDDMNTRGFQHQISSDNDEVIASRRILYYAMTDIAGLVPNPYEIWHFGLGDPYSATLSNQRPYYSTAELPEWYVAEMTRLQRET